MGPNTDSQEIEDMVWLLLAIYIHPVLPIPVTDKQDFLLQYFDDGEDDNDNDNDYNEVTGGGTGMSVPMLASMATCGADCMHVQEIPCIFAGWDHNIKMLQPSQG
jgi:hypothetical protein